MQLHPAKFLAFLESVGTTELLVVLVVALVVFGPRRLPEIGRAVGQALRQVRSVSDDFIGTWEAEALQESGPRRQRALPAADEERARVRRVGQAGAPTQSAGPEAESDATAPADASAGAPAHAIGARTAGAQV